MDVKRYINTRIWSDTWFEELEGIERLIWLYLLTNQQTNLIGIYEIGLRRISNESGVDFNRLVTVMERFANDSKAFHNGRFVIIPNYLRNQTLANQNMVKSASNLYHALPDDVKKVLQSLGIDDFENLRKGLPNRLPTVTKPFANRTASESESESEIEREEESEMPLISGRSLPRYFKDPLDLSVVDDSLDEKKEKKKVAPKKKSQLEIMSSVVLPWDSQEFTEIWKIWLDYRTKKKKPYLDEMSMQAALKQLSVHNEQIVMWAIEDSIAQGWQGLFPEKDKYHERLRKSQPTGNSDPAQFDRLRAKIQERLGGT